MVTGASCGLGAQLSVDLARAGATVYGLARNTERLEKLATDLRTFTPRSGTITCDVADTAALRQALEEVAATHGPVDLLVKNAAQDPGVRLVDITEEDFRHTFDVNFFAPVAASLAVLPAMLERGSGIVVNVSSDGGRLPSRSRGLSLLQGRLVRLHRVQLVPSRTQGGPRPRGVPAFMATELGLGALERGLRRPPRLTTRSVETVPRRILARAGGPALEISVSSLIDAAMVFRSLLPRTYHRLRRHW